MTADLKQAFHLHLADGAKPVVLPTELPAPYRLVLLPMYPEPQFSEAVQITFRGPTGTVDPALLGGTDETLLAWRKERHRQLPQIRMAVLCGHEFAGWCFGLSTRVDTFHMASSAVLEPHRRKGLYTAMANALLQLVRDAGYNALTSHHIATNNSILIAKMKLGFLIVGVELDARNGVLLSMEYPLHEARRTVLRARSGEILIPPELAEQLCGG